MTSYFLILLGVFNLGLGAFIWGAPLFAKYTLFSMAATLLIIAGIAHAIHVIKNEELPRLISPLLVGIIYIGGGIGLFIKSPENNDAFSTVLGLFLIGIAILKISRLFRTTQVPRPWTFAEGVGATIIGFFLISATPQLGGLIGTFAAFDLFVTGAASLSVGLALHR